jgi:hypothetical protein
VSPIPRSTFGTFYVVRTGGRTRRRRGCPLATPGVMSCRGGAVVLDPAQDAPEARQWACGVPDAQQVHHHRPDALAGLPGAFDTTREYAMIRGLGAGPLPATPPPGHVLSQ